MILLGTPSTPRAMMMHHRSDFAPTDAAIVTLLDAHRSALSRGPKRLDMVIINSRESPRACVDVMMADQWHDAGYPLVLVDSCASGASFGRVALNTMRPHTKSGYAKLGVTSRRAAVRRAEELAPLSSGPTR